MANNYSQQPPFGFPFAFPPPPPPSQMYQPSSASHVDSEASPADALPPPVHEAFQSMWNLPGLNLGAYGQNAQQQQYPPNAWPPPPPNSWGSIPFPLFQNGVIPPPPFPPTLSIPPAPLPQASLPSFAAASAAALIPPDQPSPLRGIGLVAPAGRITEVMDSDVEDGEVSEGEITSHSPATNGHQYPMPSRSVPKTSQNIPSTGEEEYNPDHPAAGQTQSQAVPQATSQVDINNSLEKLVRDREAAKQFVRLLYSHNIGYQALAKENLDNDQLRELYKSVNLPSEPEPLPPAKADGATSPVFAGVPASTNLPARPPSTTAGQTKPVTSVTTNVNPVPSTKSIASPIDRKDYIARLQAAKMAKQPAGTKAASQQKTPPEPEVSVSTPTQTPQSSGTPTAKQPVTDEQRARNTELIRQRLEAMKAKAALTTKNSSVPEPAPSTQAQVSQTPSDLNPMAAPFQNFQHFAGLPGLTMNAPTSAAPFSVPQQNSIPAPPPRKRYGPADVSEVSTPRSTGPTYTRPLGQSPHAHDAESMIIEVSDDESVGSEMDIDEDHVAPKPSQISLTELNPNPPQTPGIQNQAHMIDLPSRSTSVRPASSAVSTPGAQTPGSLARKEELQKKEKELAAMRLTLKKKLEEKRQREKAAAATSGGTPSSLPPKPETPKFTLQLASSAKKPGSIVATPSSMPLNPNTDMSRELKRRRRAEIESELPSLDAEIANNAARMAQLTKEMDQLVANNERIAKDKERLTMELESLGIDTEGMSHAELLAKKDEIEHERDEENELVSSTTGFQSQSGSTVANGIETVVAPEQPPAAPKENPIHIESIEQSAPSLVEDQSSAQYTQLPGLGAVPTRKPDTSFAIPSQVPIMGKEETMVQHCIKAPNLPSETSPEAALPRESHIPALLSAALTDSGKVSHARASATPVDDDDDFYSPEPLNNAPTNLEPEGARVSQPSGILPEDEGDVAMSESSEDEEEYEPEDTQMALTAAVSEPPKEDLATASTQGSLEDSSDDEEAYEPPEVDQDAYKPHTNSMESTTGPDDSQVEAEDGAMDISSSSGDDSDDSDSDSESDSSSEGGDDTSAPDDSPQHRIPNVADDLAPELQPQAMDQTSVSDPSSAADGETHGFVPYESPLRIFKSYRYHPKYSQDVPGGYLSLTYSHQIDPEQPLCQYESIGGSCNDPQCAGQHFRGMSITGDKLLVQLGTANPGKTGEERQLWNDGLRGVLKELRKKNIKDPNGIAEEIARYRRQFLKDDTRVVNL